MFVTLLVALFLGFVWWFAVWDGRRLERKHGKDQLRRDIYYLRLRGLRYGAPIGLGFCLLVIVRDLISAIA